MNTWKTIRTFHLHRSITINGKEIPSNAQFCLRESSRGNRYWQAFFKMEGRTKSVHIGKQLPFEEPLHPIDDTQLLTVSKIREENEALTYKLRSQLEEIRRLRTEHHKLQADFDEQFAMIHKLKAENHVLSQKVTQLQREIDRLRPKWSVTQWKKNPDVHQVTLVNKSLGDFNERIDDLLLHPGVKYCEFKAGDIFMRQGEKLDYVYYLKSGSCYRNVLTAEGEEVVLQIKKPGDNFIDSILGLVALFIHDSNSINSFIAKSKCCCYKIPRATMINYVVQKPDLLMQIIHRILRYERERDLNFQSRMSCTVSNRLCEILLLRSQVDGDNLCVKGFMSNELSGQLGINKSTLSRILRALREEGIIEKAKDGILIINKKRLQDYAFGEVRIRY